MVTADRQVALCFARVISTTFDFKEKAQFFSNQNPHQQAVDENFLNLLKEIDGNKRMYETKIAGNDFLVKNMQDIISYWEAEVGLPAKAYVTQLIIQQKKTPKGDEELNCRIILFVR